MRPYRCDFLLRSSYNCSVSRLPFTYYFAFSGWVAISFLVIHEHLTYSMYLDVKTTQEHVY